MSPGLVSQGRLSRLAFLNLIPRKHRRNRLALMRLPDPRAYQRCKALHENGLISDWARPPRVPERCLGMGLWAGLLRR